MRLHFARDFRMSMLRINGETPHFEIAAGKNMRLICPNCDAQYEVPDQVMPVDGRDVQCSNCGKTWFQHHPGNAPEEHVRKPAPDPDEEVAEPPETPAPTSTEPEPAAPERRRLDPAVADILRQEAEAEHEARQRGGVEVQPGLGLDTSDTRTVEQKSQDRNARLRDMRPGGDATPNPVVSKAVAAALNSRRDLLPDIEEINSSLSSTSDAPGKTTEIGVEAPTRQRKKRGFRRAFFSIILIAVLLALLYIFAPQIMTSVPASQEIMTSYVSTVDSGRVWLDGQVQTFLMWLDSLTAEPPTS